ASGGPVAVPSQDMVLGIYYLTKMASDQKGEGKTFANTDEVLIAYDRNRLDMHAKINVRIPKKDTEGEEEAYEIIKTTTGRVIFNRILPKEIGYINRTLGKKELRSLINDIHYKVGTARTSLFLDEMKELGFEDAKINVRIPKKDTEGEEEAYEIIKTTTGSVIFNRILPKEIGYINRTLGKKELRSLINDIHYKVGTARTSLFLDEMKKLGFEQA